MPVVQLTYRRVALVSYVWNAACCRYHKRDALRSIYCDMIVQLILIYVISNCYDNNGTYFENNIHPLLPVLTTKIVSLLNYTTILLVNAEE